MNAIRLSNIFRETISSRLQLHDILSPELEQNKIIILDFKDIEFISRSCADELLRHEDRFIFKNVSSNVKEMLDVVRPTRHRSSYKKRDIHIDKVVVCS